MYVLQLNASFEPMAVITARNAFKLLLADKAEIVDPDTKVVGYFRSEKVWIDVPAVIRLKRHIKLPYRATISLSRSAVLARDNKTCGYCLDHGDTMDHIVPRSRGGKHVWENVVTACSPCNAKKRDHTLKELGWHLKIKPYAPKATYWIVLKFGSPDPAWEPYLAMA